LTFNINYKVELARHRKKILGLCELPPAPVQ
jgi:hypothetical protein